MLDRDFDSPENYFGLIIAVIYPSPGLDFPIQPYQIMLGKLGIILCAPD